MLIKNRAKAKAQYSASPMLTVKYHTIILHYLMLLTQGVKRGVCYIITVRKTICWDVLTSLLNQCSSTIRHLWTTLSTLAQTGSTKPKLLPSYPYLSTPADLWLKTTVLNDLKLTSSFIKVAHNLTTKYNQHKMLGKDLSRHFSKEDTKVAHGMWKMLNLTYL